MRSLPSDVLEQRHKFHSMSVVRQYLRNTILSSSSYAFALKKYILRMSVKQGSFVILPGGIPGSLGDEAMLVGMLTWLANHNVQNVALINYRPEDEWPNVPGFCEYIHLPIIRKGQLFRFLQNVSKYEQFYIHGADVLDGTYSVDRSLMRIRCARIVNRLGVNVTIAGFSFCAQPALQAVNALRKLPENVRLCARDPVSHRRLLSLLNRPVDLVADLAFLLEPNYGTQFVCQIVNWIEKEKKRGRIVIGINANRQVLETKGVYGCANIIVDCECKILKALFNWNNDISFLILPHDFRGELNDAYIGEAIYWKLPSNIKPFCKYIDMPCSAGEIKAIVRELWTVFTGRMHIAIACLGEAVPVGCICYQGKFDGLFELFEMDEMIVEPFKDELDIDRIVELIKRIVSNRKFLTRKITTKIPYVKELAAYNLRL